MISVLHLETNRIIKHPKIALDSSLSMAQNKGSGYSNWPLFVPHVVDMANGTFLKSGKAI